MKAIIDLCGQFLFGLLICSGLAVGMSYIGSRTVVGGEEQEAQLAIGHCRKCSNPIRFLPGEWCAACRACGQLTNMDQVRRRD